jgi:membrane fusion protein, multidrug efflux system
MLAVIIAFGGGAAYWYSTQTADEAMTRPTRRPAVPVVVATAARQNMPIYLSGLGTVQALVTVAIHSQVDGKLQEVLFTEGQRVKKGDVLVKIDPRLFQAALDQAKAKRAQDEAMLVAAEKDLVRFKALVAKNFETEQNVDLQVAKVDQLKAAIEADAAAIGSAQTQLDYTTIAAPNDGRMGVRLVDAGNTVRASDAAPIATLVQMQPATVLFTLPQRSLDDVRRAAGRGEVEVTVFDQDNERALGTGKLLMVDNLIDPASSTYRLKAIFPNADDRLWPGDFVNARLLLETRISVVAIPSAAIQTGPEGLYAWVIGNDNTATAHPIEIGPSTGDLTIVSSGVQEGDQVVVEGQYKLEQHSPVTISTTPASSPDKGPA